MAKSGGGTLTRTITAFFLIALTLSFIWIPALELGFLLYACATGGCALYEFYKFVKAKDPKYHSYLALPLGVAIIASGYWFDINIVNATFAAAALVVAFTHIIKPNATMSTMLPSLFGLGYISWTAAHFVMLYKIEAMGPVLTTMLIAAVSLSDTGAYFVGKSIGKHKLAPVVSPNKTWEGSVGGFVFCVAFMATLYFLREQKGWGNVPDWSLTRYIIIGAILSVASQIGDLTESAFKRDAGVKDSGTIFPGHGGALDRCDGLFVTAPVLYYLSIF